MSDKPSSKGPTRFSRQVGVKEMRKLKAQKAAQSIWFGFGMFGLIGWSVAVPTLLGAMLGLWLDKHHSAKHSWTLSLLILGLLIGCLNAWHWVEREHTQMRHDAEDKDE